MVVTSHQASPSKQRKQPSTYQKRLLFFTIKVLQSPERHRDAGSRESRGSREPAPSRDLKASFLWESVGPLPVPARRWREPLGAGPRCAHTSRPAPGSRCSCPQSRTRGGDWAGGCSRPLQGANFAAVCGKRGPKECPAGLTLEADKQSGKPDHLAASLNTTFTGILVGLWTPPRPPSPASTQKHSARAENSGFTLSLWGSCFLQ